MYIAQANGYLPDFPGTSQVVRANISVRIDEDGYIQGEPIIILANYHEFFSLGPLWFWRSDLNGKLVAESLINNALVDQKSVQVTVERSWLGGNEKTFQVAGLKLGEQYSGNYTIRLKVVRDDGSVQDTRNYNITI